MADKADSSKYSIPFVHQYRTGQNEAFVCTPPKGGLWLIFVNDVRAREVEVDQAKKTISIDVDRMADFQQVEFVGGLRVLRFSAPKK